MTNTVLITGSMGYLGGRIAAKLAEQSKLELRLGTHKSKTNLPEWLKTGRFIPLDMTSEADIVSACQGVQSIIHLAALNERDSKTNPEQALVVSGLGTLKLVKAAQTAGVKKIIYFSTVHVYGSPLVGKITEQTIPRPSSPYAITHRIAEDIVLTAHDSKVLCGIVVRLSNAIGSPMHHEINQWNLVVNDFCYQAVTNKKIVLKSSGLQMKDFITIEDITRAVLHFLDLSPSNCDNGLFNLGGENPMRIIDMAEFISDRCSKVFGFKPEVVRPKPKQDETSEALSYSIDKLKSTGFSLERNIDQEIDATLRFCLNTFGNKTTSSISTE